MPDIENHLAFLVACSAVGLIASFLFFSIRRLCKPASCRAKRRQFSLRTLFVATAIVGVSLMVVRWWYIGQQRIAWRDASVGEVDTYRQTGQPVLVVFAARVGSLHMRFGALMDIDTPVVRRLIFSRNVIVLRVPDDDVAIREMIPGFSPTSQTLPDVILFPSSPSSAPTVITHLEKSDERVVAALRALE